jgi:type I restriction enzyme, S subunit
MNMFELNKYKKEKLLDLIKRDSSISYGIVQPGNEVKDGLPVLRPVDIINDEINFDSIKKIEPSLANNYKKTNLCGGEILIVVRGEPGCTVLTDEKVKGFNITRGLAVINPDLTKINPHYLTTFLKSDLAQRYIKKYTRGAALRQINLRDLKNLNVPIPPETLQKKFAAIAKQVELMKEHQKQSKEQLDNLYNALMQKAFNGELKC